MFVHQPTFISLDMKKGNYKYKVSAWKSKGMYNSELRSFHSLTPVIKYLADKIELQFNNSV